MSAGITAMNRASDALLLHDMDRAIDSLGETQENLNRLVTWIMEWERLNKGGR
jgi:hypothetical protein